MNKLYRVLILLAFFGLGISCASAANVISFNPQTVEVNMGSSQNVQIVMNEVPYGLSGFNLTISVSDPEIAEITAASFPDWNSISDNSTSTVPSNSVWIKSVDLGKRIGSSSTNVSLGNITINGKKVGTADLNILKGSYYDPDGYNYTEHTYPDAIQSKINVLDNESPVINSVSLNNSKPYINDSILVTVNVTSNVGVSGVKANDVSLLNQGGSIWNGNITALAGIHPINVFAMNEAGKVAWNNSTSYTGIARDIIPPSSIADLLATTGTKWISWTWQNPIDPDFSHIEIYLNGTFQTTTSNEYFNAPGLEPEASYTIGTRTVDINGNVNKTWVNSTRITSKLTLPVANFSTNVSKGYTPVSVQFTELSKNATEWNWDFGDESTSTEQNPIHTYSTTGNYTVNLTVNNENGTASKLATITVSARQVPVLPVANFSTNTTKGSAPLSVQFTDSSENAAYVNWNFGDGATSTEKNPIHTYSRAGIYKVKLTASNENGSASKLATIIVPKKVLLVLPVANFTSNVTSEFVLKLNLIIQWEQSLSNWTEKR